MPIETSRRNVVKAASWTVPSVVIASAAPAMAASAQSVVYAESTIQELTAQYNSSDLGEPIPTEQYPAFDNDGSLGFYKTNAQSATLEALTYQIVIPSPNAKFQLVNGTNKSNWSLPSAPSGTDVINGKTVYVYDFVYTNAKLPASFSAQGSDQLLSILGNDSVLVAQIIGGDNLTAGDPFQGRIVATIDGTVYNRSSDTQALVTGAQERTGGIVIGDEL